VRKSHYLYEMQFKDLTPLFLNLIVLFISVIIFYGIFIFTSDFYYYKFPPSNRDIEPIIGYYIIIFIPVSVITVISDLIIKYYLLLTSEDLSQKYLFQKMFLCWNILWVGTFLITLILTNIQEYFGIINFVTLITSLLLSLLISIKFELYSLKKLAVIILNLFFLVIITYLTILIMFLIYVTFLYTPPNC
jgi:hypothetical protein